MPASYVDLNSGISDAAAAYYVVLGADAALV
jgi:hypothetical protein